MNVLWPRDPCMRPEISNANIVSEPQPLRPMAWTTLICTGGSGGKPKWAVYSPEEPEAQNWDSRRGPFSAIFL